MRFLPTVLSLVLLSLPAFSASADDMTFTERCEQEIRDLHAFLQQWSVGELPNTDDAYARFGDALAPDFSMVDTDGSVVSRDAIVGGVRGAHNRWPGGGSIGIGEVQPVMVQGDVAVLTYIEHHEFDAGEGRKMSMRRSSVTFHDDADGPNGVRWKHLQETWIMAPHAVCPDHGSGKACDHHGDGGHGDHNMHGDHDMQEAHPGNQGHHAEMKDAAQCGDEWTHSGESGTGHDDHASHDDYAGHTAHGDAGHGEMGHGDHNSPGFQHDFSDVERWAKIFDDPERVDWQKPEHIIDLMKVEPGMHVADLGAGTGFFLGYLSVAVGEGGKVQALDVADSLVDHMRERAAEAGWDNVTSRLVATDDPAFEPGSMDRVLIVDVWHHISNRADYAERLLAGLSPTGQVVVVDFTLDSPEGPPKQHRMAPEQVVAELEAGGLKAWVVEDEDLPRQYVVVASRP